MAELKELELVSLKERGTVEMMVVTRESPMADYLVPWKAALKEKWKAQSWADQKAKVMVARTVAPWAFRLVQWKAV